MADAQGLTALRRLAEAAVERNRRIGERLIAEIERRRARIRKEFYEIGICLQQLAAPKIYAALGFASFGELLDGRGLLTRSQAYRLVAVVGGFTKEQALAIGAEKAYALTRYVAATPAEDVAAQLLSMPASPAHAWHRPRPARRRTIRSRRPRSARSRLPAPASRTRPSFPPCRSTTPIAHSTRRAAQTPTQ